MPKDDDTRTEIALSADTTFDAICSSAIRGKTQFRAESAKLEDGNTLSAKTGVDGRFGGLKGSITGSREKHFQNAEQVLKSAYTNQMGQPPSPQVQKMMGDAVRGKLAGAADLNAALGQIRDTCHQEIIANLKQGVNDPTKAQAIDSIVGEMAKSATNNRSILDVNKAQQYKTLVADSTPAEAVKLAKKMLQDDGSYGNGQNVARSLLSRDDISTDQMCEIYGTELRKHLEAPSTNDGNILRGNTAVTGFSRECMKQYGAQYVQDAVTSAQTKANAMTDPTADDISTALLESLSEQEDSMSPEMKQFAGTGYKTAQDVLGASGANAARLGANAPKSVLTDAIVLRSVNPSITDTGVAPPFGTNTMGASKSLQKQANNALTNTVGANETPRQATAKQSFLTLCDSVGQNNGTAIKPQNTRQAAHIGGGPPRPVGDLAQQVANRARGPRN